MSQMITNELMYKINAYASEVAEVAYHYQERKITYAQRKYKEMKKLYQCANR